MPLYEYECERCGKKFEVIQKFSDDPVSACTYCGGPVHRLLSSPAVQFKGTGWYVTDYARKSPPGSPSADDTKRQSDAAAEKADNKPAASADTAKETKAADSAPPKPSSSTTD